MKKLMSRILPPAIGKGFNLLNTFAPTYAAKKAFELFCKPRKGKLRPKDHAFLETAEEAYLIPTAHERMKTYVWNSKGQQTMLLIHGWESNAARWQLMIEQLLKQNYQVIAIDAPAHGASEGLQFNVLKYANYIHIAATQFEPDFIMGHSLGGATLSYYLTHFSLPSSLKKCGFLGAPAEFKDAIQTFVNILSLSDKMHQSIETYFLNTFGKRTDYFSAERFCPQINLPCLVIHDEEDKVVKVEDGKVIVENLKNVDWMMTKGFGHSLQDQKVFEKVLSYFSRPVESKVKISASNFSTETLRSGLYQ